MYIVLPMSISLSYCSSSIIQCLSAHSLSQCTRQVSCQYVSVCLIHYLFLVTQGTFIINEISGEIRVSSSSLMVSTYFLAVGMSRQGIVKTVWVNVSVKDVNNPPEFDRDVYRVSYALHV